MEAEPQRNLYEGGVLQQTMPCHHISESSMNFESDEDIQVKSKHQAKTEKKGNKFSQLLGLQYVKKKIQAWKKKRQVDNLEKHSNRNNEEHHWWEQLKEEEENDCQVTSSMAELSIGKVAQTAIKKPPAAKINEHASYAENSSLYPQLTVTQAIPSKTVYYPPGVEVIDQYILKQTIGTGSFSQVKLAVHSVTNEPIAIKMIDRAALNESTRLRMTVMREVELLRSLKHSSIVKFFDVVETKSHLCILMEWIPGGELFQYVTVRGKLSECETKIIMKQLLLVVDFLHAHGVVHRDLKLENVIVDSRFHDPVSIKLIDFGLARTFKSNQLLSTRCGSEEYAAPEIIRGDLYDGRKSDVWSLGIIMYACLFGALPFNPESNRPKALYEKICRTFYKIPNNIASPEAVDLIRRILIANPEERPTIQDILSSEWILSAS